MEFQTDLTKSIFESKYLLKGETKPSQAVDRVVSVVHDYYPEYSERIKNYINKRWLLPAGGLWRAARNPDKNVSVINCTALPKPEDNLESMLKDTLYWWGKYGAFGQGEGLDLSNLRPRGAKVHNAARNSTGAVSYMFVLDTVVEYIAQQGRRGATLVSISIDHPDVEEFIYVKTKDNVLNNMNLSIQITDKFMKAVQNREEWILHFENEYEIIEKKLKASDLFEKICEQAWKTGSPGLQFLDTAQRFSNSDYLGFPVNQTNACSFSPDTLVTTKEGVFPITELVGKKVKVWDSTSWVEVDNFRKTGNDDLYRISLYNGSYFDATTNHRFLLSDGQERTLENLQIGNELWTDFNVESHGTHKERGAYIKGFLLGDGSIYQSSSKNPIPYFMIFKTKYMCMDKIVASLEEIPLDPSVNENAIKEVSWNTEKFDRKTEKGNNRRLRGLACRERSTLYKWGSDYKKSLPNEVFCWDKESKIDLISGIFDSDGSYEKKGFYRLFSSEKEFLVSILRLLGTFGIDSRISIRGGKGKKIVINNVETIFNKDAWVLTIPVRYSVKLYNIVNFQRLPEPKSTNNKLRKLSYSKITSIENLNKKSDVYCCTVSTNERFLVNSGIVSLNSEQFLDPHNVCLLASKNIAKYQIDYGTEISDDITCMGIILLDAFRNYEIDEDRSPNPIQKQKLIDMPRIGLGVTGLADYFINHRIPYASVESHEHIIEIFGNLAKYSYYQSNEIACEHGSFPLYDKEKYMQSPYIQMLLSEGWIKDEWLDEQAHVCKTTIAPNGTLSMVAEVGGSGIEPIFARYYVRRERSTKQGDWTEHFTFNDAVRNYLNEQGLEVTKENADNLTDDFWVTAHSLDYYDKLRMMGIIQKYIDSSISVTFNLPNDATVQDVKNIYYEAWVEGLKGVTVFRDGCKPGILITEENYTSTLHNKTISNRFTPVRPETIECDIYQMSVNKERHIVIVGLIENKPYEIFVTNDPDNQIDLNKHKKGYITKIKKGRYDLQIQNGEEKTILENIGKVFDSVYGSLSRFISMSLRHNVPVQFITDQLSKDSEFVSFERAVSRILKKYIIDGEEVLSSKKCSECGGQMVYMDHCATCIECGYSACS